MSSILEALKKLEKNKPYRVSASRPTGSNAPLPEQRMGTEPPFRKPSTWLWPLLAVGGLLAGLWGGSHWQQAYRIDTTATAVSQQPTIQPSIKANRKRESQLAKPQTAAPMRADQKTNPQPLTVSAPPSEKPSSAPAELIAEPLTKPKSSMEPVLPKNEAQKTMAPKSHKPAKPTSRSSGPDSRPPISIQALAWSTDPKRRVAVLNNQIVHEGSQVEGVTIEAIEKNAVRLRLGEQHWSMPFHKSD